jgi:hypothetical protein
MMRWRVAVLLAVAPLAMGQQCNPNYVLQGVRILEPHANATRTCKPFRLEVDFNAVGDPDTLVVLVNGVDVSDRFTPGASYNGRLSAGAEWVWEEGVVFIGENTIEATVVFPQSVMRRTRTFTVTGDPFVDDVVSFTVGEEGGFNLTQLPGVVLGAPFGAGLFTGSTDVFSLGKGGVIDLVFQDNLVYDGEGPDFTVFENSFLTLEPGLISGPPFSEPGRVSVSQDGATWYTFPCALDIAEGPYHPGCAGVYPVLSDGTASTPHASFETDVLLENLVGLPALSIPLPDGAGGNSFDLADVGLVWAKYVRIEAAEFVDGPSGPGTYGFDLDAVVAIHSIPAVDAAQTSVPDCPVGP